MASSNPDMDIIEDSTLRGIAIRKTIIKHCVLRYVEIYTSEILNSVLEHCRLFNSTIDGSSLEDTKIHECKFKGLKMKRCEVTTSPLNLRRFPPEIRQMIFQYSNLRSISDQKAPQILVALRSDSILYHEALRVFYNQNWCHLRPENVSSIGMMSMKTASNIQRLSIK